MLHFWNRKRIRRSKLLKHRFGIIGNQAFSILNFRAPLLTEIVSRGHEVYALAPDFDEETRRAVSALGVEPIDISLSRTGTNPARDLSDTIRLISTLNGLELDTVLTFAIKPVIYGTLAAKLSGVPNRFALIAGLGYAFGQNTGQSIRKAGIHYAAKILYKLALRHANSVFLQNPDDGRELVELGIVPKEKVILVNGTGIDLEQWPPAKPVNSPVTFLLAARLLAEKGIPEFVEAARRVRKRDPSTRFIILGGLDSNPSGIPLRTMDEWIEEGVIEWPGHVAVRSWIESASVYVLPSYYREGVPRSIQEAMAIGRPIITTDMPGCRETVVEGWNGFLVSAQDVNELVGAMLRFIDEPDLIAIMGSRSRVLAKRKFDVREINSIMIDEMKL